MERTDWDEKRNYRKDAERDRIEIGQVLDEESEGK